MRARRALRLVLAIFMIGIGAAHFARPTEFASIVPAWLPSPVALVLVSGVFEILGGAGLLVARTRRAASLGLVALYVAVFPANLNMAVHHIAVDGVELPSAALWLRLPFQLVFIAWAWWVGRPATDEPRAPALRRQP